jgi:hypothetical protein
MTKTISIKSLEFEVSTPYVEGHAISAAEAKALNQVRAENIGNNMRKAVTDHVEGKEGAKSLAELQAEFAAYDRDYVFTLASAGGSKSTETPLERETRSVAKAWLATKLKEAGTTAKAYKEKNGADYVENKILEVMANEEIVKLAKKNLAAKEATAKSGADIQI